MTRAPGAGLQRMRELALSLPSQLLDGFDAGRQLQSTVPGDRSHWVLVGMGGSGIAGDLLSALASPESARTVDVVRSPELPRAVARDSLVLLISYSGNTWETLEAYGEAGNRGAQRIVVASGGQLAERASRDAVPWLRVPGGLPPRAAVGYLFGGLLALAEPIFPESNGPRLARAVQTLRAQADRLTSASGLPRRLARKVGRRTPLVYVETAFAALGRRWATQVEENAKRLAHFDVVPELFHNAIVPWDAISRAEAARRCVLLLEWSEEDPRVAERFRYLERLLAARGVPRQKVPLASTDRLDALLLGLWVGDLFSLALAEDAGVDPYEVAAIERMKEALSTSRPGVPSGR